MNVTFTEYLRELYPYSDISLEEKMRQISVWRQACLQGQDLEGMDAVQLLRLIESLRDSYTAQTLNNMLSTLEQYYGYLMETGKRQSHSPVAGFRIRTEKKPILRGLLTEEEMNALYAGYSDRGHHRGQFDAYRQRNKAVLGFMVHQGLDSGSLHRLELKSVDLSKGIVEVSPSSQYKLSKRILTLEAVQIMDLYRYMQETRPALLKLVKAPKDIPLLFPTSANTKFSSITKSIRRHLGIKDPLLLRNSRIALWMKRYNLRQVQYMAGYRTLLSLEKFNTGKIEQLRQAIDKYHPF
jgi:integrase/recombinase XerD